MSFFRNTEIKRLCAELFIFSAVASAAAFFKSVFFGLFTLAVCAVFCIITLASTKRRYSRFAVLSNDIDKILHGDNTVDLSGFSEGELSVLSDELSKMTAVLKNQTELLSKEKINLSDSIADISHQIRTPLTSINLLVSMLNEPGLSPERQKDLISQLRTLLSHIEWLINALLKMSKIDAGTIAFSHDRSTLRELCEKSSAGLLIPIELRGQSLIVDAQGDFTGDTAWTAEALGNILKNCSEHTGEGGVLTIFARETPLYYSVEITDTGEGIAEADLPHIFERFYKGKNSSSNSVGIGLALARLIISSQNGTVKAENISPNGCRFSVRIYKQTV